MNPPTPPKCIAEALESAMRHDPEARWSDTTPFAHAVWDALLAEGGVRIISGQGRDNSSHDYLWRGEHKPLKPADGYLRVLVLPLPALGDDPQEAHRA